MMEFERKRGSGTGLEGKKERGRRTFPDVVIKEAPFQFSIAFNMFVINSFLPFLFLSYYLILALLKLIMLCILIII